MQLLNILFEDPKGNEIAIAAIRRSKVWSTVVTEISKRVTDKQMPELQIVALFKAGRYTDKGWSLLQHAMADIVDLPAPSTVRKVGNSQTWSCLLFIVCICEFCGD
jgi:hypothetical protein